MIGSLRASTIVVFVLAGALLQGGCATSRAELPPQAKTGLESINASLADGKAQLSSTIQALKALDRRNVDVASASNAYRASLAKLDDSIGRTRAGIKSAEKPDEFFHSWNADLNSISNTQLRESGKERYAEAREELEQLNKKIGSLRETFAPFHKDLEDIGTYLKNDPTEAGLKQIKPTIRRVLNTNDDVVKQIDAIQSGIEAMLK